MGGSALIRRAASACGREEKGSVAHPSQNSRERQHFPIHQDNAPDVPGKAFPNCCLNGLGTPYAALRLRDATVRGPLLGDGSGALLATNVPSRAIPVLRSAASRGWRQ